MSLPKDISKKLRDCPPEIAEFTKALQSENVALNRKLLKVEAKNLSLKNRVAALEKHEKVLTKQLSNTPSAWVNLVESAKDHK